ncbi:MAG: DUF6941 family protein, partial [Gemmatimonadota bacterium]
MHVSFALFADAANISQEGKLNILGVFDAVQVGQLPAVHPRAHLADRGLHVRHPAGSKQKQVVRPDVPQFHQHARHLGRVRL